MIFGTLGCDNQPILSFTKINYLTLRKNNNAQKKLKQIEKYS